MSILNKILKRGKKSRAQSELTPSLGGSQPSSCTVGSYNTSTSPNSHISLGSQGYPENAEDYRIPVELDAPGNRFWVPVPRTPQQLRYNQQDEQQQQQRIIIIDEETINQARKANDTIAQRNKEKRILERKRNASADNVRRLRELIRERYSLDLYIWEKRNVPKASRKRIEPKCKKADAILQEIYFIVNDWDEDLFDGQEWQMVKRIKAGLFPKQQDNGESGDAAIWGDLAPWDRRDDNEQRLRTIGSGAGSDVDSDKQH